jgi:hypothetical protein
MSDDRTSPICTSLSRSELAYTSDILSVTYSKAIHDIRTENAYAGIGTATRRYRQAYKVMIFCRELAFSSLGACLQHSVIVFIDHLLSHEHKPTLTFDEKKPHNAGRTSLRPPELSPHGCGSAYG